MTTPPRPDQDQSPPPMVLAPGGASGVFRGRLIIVTGITAPPGSGIFVYDNTGALIGSWVGAPGTDPIDGEAVPLGFTVQNPAGTISANMQSGALTIEKFSGVAAPPQIKALDDTITAGTASGTRIAAAQIITPLIVAVTPGDNTGGAETWHSLGSPSATGYTSGHGRYRMTPEGEVEFDILLTGTSGNGTAGVYTYANTLPVAYRPAVQRVYPLAFSGTVSAGENHGRLNINTDGTVQIVLLAASIAGGQAFMPLD